MRNTFNKLITFIRKLHQRVLWTDLIVLAPLVYHALAYLIVGGAPDTVLPEILKNGGYIAIELIAFFLFNIGLYFDSRNIRIVVTTVLIFIATYICLRYLGTRGINYAYNLAYLIGHVLACIFNYYHIMEFYRRRDNGTLDELGGMVTWRIF